MHDMAGTTRDTIDTVIESAAGPVRILDTAGMRRRGKIDQSTEYYSVVRALRAIDSADVALLVIDALIGVTHQDQRLAERATISGSPVVLLLNKWEVADAEQREDVTEQVADRLKFLPNVKVLKISALTGKGTHKILEALLETADTYHRRIPTAKVNEVLKVAQAHQAAPRRGPGALRHPGRHRPADVHAVHQPAPAADLPPLSRAQAPGGLRDG